MAVGPFGWAALGPGGAGVGGIAVGVGTGGGMIVIGLLTSE
jgi:hypothetical protein